MIVTALEPVGKTRVRVFLDGEKAFVLYRNEAYRMGIREGESLSEQAYADHAGDPAQTGQAALHEYLKKCR